MESENYIVQRVDALRRWMKRAGVDAFVTPSTDAHAGEYVPAHWQSRQWISGFTGSAGTAVVTADKAALWTDSRYFIQAEEELAGTPFVMMKDGVEGTPSIAEWLGSVLAPGCSVGVDGEVNMAVGTESLRQELKYQGMSLCVCADPYAEIWDGRPERPLSKAEIQPLEFAGESTISKLARIREKMGAGTALVACALDEIAWTLNLRGEDVECTPLLVSYLLVEERKATLYIDQRKLTDETRSYLADCGVTVKEYADVYDDLQSVAVPCYYMPSQTNCKIYNCLVAPKAMTDSIITQMLIVKNQWEIEGYRRAMLRDGVAMVKWLKWLTAAVAEGGQTELSVSRRLTEFRAEQPLFRGLSFENIVAYAAHGAIVHYEVNETTDVELQQCGLLLVDSGAQYQDGTTDLTRTIPLGTLTDEERRDYTLVLRGFINLGRAVFPRGTCGTQLDALARAPMWQYGINYLHGTGHGVGAYLSVHEGPHQIRMNYKPQWLVPGMTVTDEPGIYIAGSHGVRHENTLLVVEADFSAKGMEGNGGVVYGPYYTFEHLTLCPFFTEPILQEMLQPEEKEWFNAYQKRVCDALSPLLDEEHRRWLKEMTKPIEVGSIN